MENQILIALKNNKLLKNILFTELDLSGIKGNLMTLSEGEILYREGDKSEYLYLIVSGEMNVIRKKGSRRTLSEIFTDHDFFGSDEFIQSGERKSTAVALRDSYIIALTKNEVDSLIEQDDEILTNLYESLHQEEPEADIDAPVDEVNFKKASKQEISFADRVKQQKDSEAGEESVSMGDSEESTIDNSLETSPDKAQEQAESGHVEKSVDAEKSKETTEEPFVSAFTQESKSFSKVEPKQTDDSPKSFKDKIDSAKENEASVDSDSNEFEIDSVSGEYEDDSSGKAPDEQIEKDNEDEKFPDTFEISYSIEDKGLDQNEIINSGEDDKMPASDDLQESGTEKDAFTGLNFGEPDLNELNNKNIGEDYTDTKFDSALKEESFGADESEEKTESDSKELEDFYSSMNDSNSVPDSSSEQGINDDDPLAGLDNYNPFPEETTEKQEESYTHEYTIGEEYKPEEDLSDSTLPNELEEELPESDFVAEDSQLPEVDETPAEEFMNLQDSGEDVKPTDLSLNDSVNEFAESKYRKEEPEFNRAETEEKPVNTQDYEEGVQSIDILEKINKAAQIVNSNIQIDDVFKSIVDVARDLTDADRGTLYLVDKKKNELWSKVAIGNEFKEIKLVMGEGLAGWVAQKGEIINLEDVRTDPRFNASFDKSSGYETKTMICFPIRNKNEEIVGVLQLINSKKGKFTKLDEELLGALSIHAALALQNADLVEQLLTGERVSSLGKMANFLLQDIKKPIMVSKRYAEHLKSKVLEEDVGRVVDMLLDQLNHIADLVQSTSSYSEGQIVLRSMLCKLNETLDDYITRVDSVLRSGNCQIAKEYDNEINVKISPKQMFQCFQHLIKNACDAMPDGGTIYLSTKIEKDNVNIIVKDNGLGIPDSLHEKIFEPFMSHGKKEGTGLGLSITKKIIEEHGGKISVISEMGEGATFIISLPIVYGM